MGRFKIWECNQMNVIETENLTKKFGDTIAVDNVSMLVKEGEIYGFLGLNGAGKTTMIRLLLGMIKPAEGSCRLFGKEPEHTNEIWNRIGYLVETPYSYPNLTVAENLKVIYRLRGLKNRNLIDQIIDKLNLVYYKNQKAQYLSSGNKQRLGLAKALIHSPELLMLDEPTNGLDPAGIVEIRNILKDLAENNNTTIFISSHILSEIAKLATRIGIIHNGKLIKEIDESELEKQRKRRLLIKTTNDQQAVHLLQNKGLRAIINNNSIIELSDSKAINHPEDIAILLVNSQLPPKLLSVYEEDLESYFLRIVKGQP
jgi:ABC-2 type transport system ATP-binding protein